MIYQYVKRYLKEHFTTPRVETPWTKLENIQFFNYLYKRYNDKKINKNISEVKEAFRDFFEPVGTLLFRYKQEGSIKFKVLPYSVDPKHSKYLDTIISIINNNKKAIIYPYKGQTDQIAITGAIRRKINLEINGIDEAVNKKELIKEAIRQALDLNERDIVVQLKRKYLVKIFAANKVTASQRQHLQKRTGIRNRYNGYSKEEMQESYSRIFEHTEVNEFFQPIMQNVFHGKLNFTEINNHYYEENALKVIQNAIAKELENYFALEEDFLFGLAGYILREHFYKVHEMMAIELLEQVYNNNENAENFLRYYTGKTLVNNNQKYKIPSLETSDGKQWSNAAVIGLSALWINIKTKIQKSKDRLFELEQKMENWEEKYGLLNLEINKLKNIVEINNQELSTIKENRRDIVQQLSTLAKNGKTYSEEETRLKRMLEHTENKIKEFEMTIHKAKKQIDEHKKSIGEIETNNILRQQLHKEIHAFDTSLDSNMSRVKQVLSSLAKALMSRKQLIS